MDSLDFISNEPHDINSKQYKETYMSLTNENSHLNLSHMKTKVT